MSRVVVSGAGIVSAIGIGLSENWEALKSAKPGVALPEILNTDHPDFMLGEVKKTTTELLYLAGMHERIWTSRTIALAALAIKEAIGMAKLTAGDLENTRLVSATSVAGMDKTEGAYSDDPSHPQKNAQVYLHHECGKSTEYIAKYIGINGGCATISTACSSSANAIMQGAKMIKHGLCEKVIVGGTDALSLFTLNGFRSLQILDKEWSRPFDETRKGLNLGEGAAYLVLESEESAQKRETNILATIAGYGNANDAFHQTASSPEGNGATDAMRAALNVSGLREDEIGYVNAHGTGTDINDSSEGNALKRIFGDNIPPYSSTKAYTGHTLAAAGSIEGVFSILALGHQSTLPNLNCSQPIADMQAPVLKMEDTEIHHVLSNSFGFGGNCSAVIYSKA